MIGKNSFFGLGAALDNNFSDRELTEAILTRTNDNNLEHCSKIPARYFSAVSSHVLFSPVVAASVRAISLADKTGEEKKEGFKKLFNPMKWSMKEREDFYKTLKKVATRRVVATAPSLALAKEISEEYNLSPASTTAINTVFEVLLASFVTKEAKERFDEVNRNLSPGRKLSDRLDNFRSNLPYQAMVMFLRNGAVVSGIYYAKKWAKNIVEIEENAKFLKENNISKDLAEISLFEGFAAGCSYAGVPADHIFQQLCHGDKLAHEVFTTTFTMIKNGKIASFFSGASARIAICLATINGSILGLKAADIMMSNAIKSENFVANMGVDHLPVHVSNQDVSTFEKYVPKALHDLVKNSVKSHNNMVDHLENSVQAQKDSPPSSTLEVKKVGKADSGKGGGDRSNS